MPATWTVSYVLMDRFLSVNEGCSQIIARATEACPRYHDRASGLRVHLPGQWLILKYQDRVPSFKVLDPWTENAPQVSIIEDASVCGRWQQRG